ncbi:MAG: hypothetical protein P8Y96_08920 [Desulfuromonadales bacterium]|jgi:hypothetical protein
MIVFCFVAFLLAGVINFTCAILLLRRLAAAGIKVSFFEMRWQVHKHMKTYRQLTAGTTDRAAWPYYGYQASLAAMIGFGLLGLVAIGQSAGLPKPD